MLKQILKIFLLAAIFLLLPNFSQAANFPLEIINIKPAGTGSPAIPATNRIFRAYPGIEYNIRAAVIGGLYPFKFALANAPSGMTINQDTGEISWPIPQSDANNISLSVTDAENTTVTTSWSITVSTSGFYFVDANAAVNGTGTIASPFSSLVNMQTGTGSAHKADIVYFRSGSYALTQSPAPYDLSNPGQSDRFPQMDFLDIPAPFTWLGYPGEIATIDGNGMQLRTGQIWFDDLRFVNFHEHGIEGVAYDYETLRRCYFNGLTTSDSINQNQGFLYLNAGSHTTHPRFLVIQDNEFTNFTATDAIGSLYTMSNSLIENNYIHGDNYLPSGSTAYQYAIAPKQGMDHLFIRGNKIIMDYGYGLGGFADSNNVDVSFNYFKIAKSDYNHGMGIILNSYGYNAFNSAFPNGCTTAATLPCYPEDLRIGCPDPDWCPALTTDTTYWRSLFYFNFYRNTVDGNFNFAYLNGTNPFPAGPFHIYNNVIINTNTGTSGYFNSNNFIGYDGNSSHLANSPWLLVNDSNNLKALPTANVINANGNLSDSTKVGTYGWETPSMTPINYAVANFVSLVSSWLQSDLNSDVNVDDMVNVKDLGVIMSKWN